MSDIHTTTHLFGRNRWKVGCCCDRQEGTCFPSHAVGTRTNHARLPHVVHAEPTCRRASDNTPGKGAAESASDDEDRANEQARPPSTKQRRRRKNTQHTTHNYQINTVVDMPTRPHNWTRLVHLKSRAIGGVTPAQLSRLCGKMMVVLAPLPLSC